MDARAVWEICVGLAGLLGSGLFNFWLVGYKVGKIRGADMQKFHDISAVLARMDKERDKQLNQNLRIFQAIEELRRRVGNGDRDWLSLTGG